MKIFNYSLIAICFSLLFFASCSKTDVAPSVNDTELLSSFLSQDVATEKGEVTEEGNFRVKVEETNDNKALFDAFRTTGNALELNEDIVLDAEDVQAIWGEAATDSFLENGITINKDDIELNRVTMNSDGEVVDMTEAEIAERLRLDYFIMEFYQELIIYEDGSWEYYESFYFEACTIIF
ncbi:MAG: hypothetical protein ACPG5B_10655 [Chitinophagales bacterium]